MGGGGLCVWGVFFRIFLDFFKKKNLFLSSITVVYLHVHYAHYAHYYFLLNCNIFSEDVEGVV